MVSMLRGPYIARWSSLGQSQDCVPAEGVQSLGTQLRQSATACPHTHTADKLGSRVKRRQNMGQGNRKRCPLPLAMSLQHPLLTKLRIMFTA